MLRVLEGGKVRGMEMYIE